MKSLCNDQKNLDSIKLLVDIVEKDDCISTYPKALCSAMRELKAAHKYINQLEQRCESCKKES